mmetsp:Transcript_26093/g.56067  ORF Transcript_26093/g.56067 Transcript_26093/m.56067 type:complete len:224 (+) Transcript_26093:301-972(+)|eukprot:CAMPEP_0172308608 /NCGR_PEP_ID=MMETSP1058-20130122/9146_1 /TAXON_ID=83371 /ORGANISM="Detonula confervacea, Strain CCMP 353" /LENGTH=223 /DNA_ID=CAMNT_0013021061 /DNA_START=250 /DNA_END=921 /DNA_ORIENTATION=+
MVLFFSRRQRHGVAVMLLATLALLAAIPTIHATPLTTQVSFEMKARRSRINDAARKLQSFSMLDLLEITNSTCPAGCPLCECTNNSSNSTNEDDDMECTLSKSIEACATNTFQKCYVDLISLLPGGDSDIEGLCNVQCANKPADGERPSATCRICDIFACCNDCPPDRAAECFPSNIEDGYTPSGWEPATCSSGGVGLLVGSGGGGSLMMILAGSFAVLGLFI